MLAEGLLCSLFEGFSIEKRFNQKYSNLVSFELGKCSFVLNVLKCQRRAQYVFVRGEGVCQLILTQLVAKLVKTRLILEVISLVTFFIFM